MTLCIYVVDLVSKSLPKLQTLIWKARGKWFNLGLELGIDEVTLKMLKTNHDDEETRFREMLSEWLRMIDPYPSWEGLLEALSQPPVGYKDLAEEVRKKQGIPKPPDKAESISLATVGSDATGWILLIHLAGIITITSFRCR